MKSDHGEFELEVPRDRNGDFKPEIVKNHQTSMTSEIEEKMLVFMPTETATNKSVNISKTFMV